MMAHKRRGIDFAALYTRAFVKRSGIYSKYHSTLARVQTFANGVVSHAENSRCDNPNHKARDTLTAVRTACSDGRQNGQHFWSPS